MNIRYDFKILLGLFLHSSVRPLIRCKEYRENTHVLYGRFWNNVSESRAAFGTIFRVVGGHLKAGKGS